MSSRSTPIFAVKCARLALRLGKAGKVLALPAIETRRRSMAFYRVLHRHQLCRGPFGLRQPGPGCPEIDPALLDLVVVPGVGFDRLGYRLGYGGGYYDRFLPLLKKRCSKVGLAFACQVVPEALPHGPQDCQIDLIVTERETIRIRPDADSMS